MRITKRQLRRIIKKEHECLNEVAMTVPDITVDIERWVEEITELFEATFTGNLETPDMGGPSPEQSEGLDDRLGGALDELKGALDLLAGRKEHY